MGALDPKPFRLRSDKYLRHIRGQPCLHCGQPSEAHHLTFAQPRAMAKKTGDQFAVPLCHTHHMELHNSPEPERSWWAIKGIDPLVWARNNFDAWERIHGIQ